MDNIVIYSGQGMMPDSRFDEMYSLICEAFPSSERRSRAGHYAEFRQPCFRSMCYQPSGSVAALMNYWQFDGFIFLEHFAVSRVLRGQGIGAAMLKELQDKAAGLPIILEAEPPSGDIERRRVKFYQRLGFCLNEYEYWQPAMQEGEQPIRLMLMSFPEALSQEGFAAARSVLYKYVYGVADCCNP